MPWKVKVVTTWAFVLAGLFSSLSAPFNLLAATSSIHSSNKTSASLSIVYLPAPSKTTPTDSSIQRTESRESRRQRRLEHRAARMERTLSGLRVEAHGSFWQYWPTINGFKETEFSPGFDVTYVNHRGFFDDRFSLYFGPLKMKDASPSMKLSFAQLHIEQRHYFRNRMYWNITAGANYFNPGSSIENFYGDRGEAASNFFKPFANIGIGWQVGKIHLPGDFSFPFLLRLKYTFSDAYEFPSTLTGGEEGIDPAGLKLTVGFRFRF